MKLLIEPVLAPQLEEAKDGDCTWIVLPRKARSSKMFVGGRCFTDNGPRMRPISEALQRQRTE
jgi:hypothetical protein